MTALTRAGETIGWLLTRYGATVIVVLLILVALSIIRTAPAIIGRLASGAGL